MNIRKAKKQLTGYKRIVLNSIIQTCKSGSLSKYKKVKKFRNKRSELSEISEILCKQTIHVFRKLINKH